MSRELTPEEFRKQKAGLVSAIATASGLSVHPILARAEMIDLASGYQMGQLEALRAMLARARKQRPFYANMDTDPVGNARYDVQQEGSDTSYFATVSLAQAQRVAEAITASV